MAAVDLKKKEWESSTDESDIEDDDQDLCDPIELCKIFKSKHAICDEKAVSFDKNTFVLNLCTDSALTHLITGNSDGSVQLYDINHVRQLGKTSYISKNSAESSGICGLRFLDDTQNNLLVGTCNGVVRLLDLRTFNEEVQFSLKNQNIENRKVGETINCFDCNANSRLICMGTELYEDNAFQLFFDVRERKFLGGYYESHSQDTTAVVFHESNPDMLCTGSTDGLINIFNVKQPDEYDALQNTLNTESSIHKLAWHKNDCGKDIISCITHTNDFKSYETWEVNSYCEFNRSNITAAIQRKNSSNINLISAHNASDNSVFLLAGTNFHKGEILRTVQIANKTTLKPLGDFIGNNQIVRESLYNAQANLLITGGESGIVTIWSEESISNMPSDGSTFKAKNVTSQHKAKPY